MPPTPLKIATDALNRLVKEEASYHKELEQQKKRIAKLEEQDDAEDENREFKLKQEKQALTETTAIFPSLRERITNQREKLQAQLDSSSNEAEIENAKKALVGALEMGKGDPDSAGVGVGGPA